MANFIELQKKARKLTPRKVRNDLFKFIRSIEDVIFDLNIKQLDDGEDADGNPLINKNKKFTGVYSQSTEDIALFENPILPKKEGELYNFGWFGDFLGNFKMDLFTDRVDIYSTGTGSGKKKAFFDGYNSLHGISPNSMVILINNHLRPFIQQYYRQQLGL